MPGHGVLGLNDGSEHMIESTPYGGEIQFYHYKEEYGDPQEAAKHKVEMIFCLRILSYQLYLGWAGSSQHLLSDN